MRSKLFVVLSLLLKYFHYMKKCNTINQKSCIHSCFYVHFFKVVYHLILRAASCVTIATWLSFAGLIFKQKDCRNTRRTHCFIRLLLTNTRHDAVWNIGGWNKPSWWTLKWRNIWSLILRFVLSFSLPKGQFCETHVTKRDCNIFSWNANKLCFYVYNSCIYK